MNEVRNECSEPEEVLAAEGQREPASAEAAAQASGVFWLTGRLPALDSGLRALAPHEQQSLLAAQAAQLGKVEGKGAPGPRAMAELVEQAVGTMGGAISSWRREPSENLLPMVGVHAARGCFIVHSRHRDGTWMIEDEAGRHHLDALPQGASYADFGQAQAVRPGHATAKSIFVDALREYRPSFAQAVVASVVINVLALVTSIYSMQVYDRVIPTQGLATLYTLTAGVLLGILLDLCAKFARSAILDQAIKGMDLGLSHKIFERLLRIRMDQFPASVGTLSAQLRTYEMIRGFASSATLYLAVDVPFALFFLFVIYTVGGPLVALVPVVFLVLALSVGLLHRRRIEEHAKSGMAASNRKLGLLVEAVESAESIKANGAGWQFLARWNALTRVNVDEDMKVRHMGETASYYSGFFQQVSYVLLVAAGAYVASTGTDLTSGGLIACSIISGRVLTPVGMLTPAQIELLTPAQIAALTPAAIGGMTGEQFAVLSDAQIDALTATQISAIQPDALAGMSPSQLAGLDGTQLGALTPDQVAHLSPEQIAALSPSAIGELPPGDVAVLSPSQVAALTPEQLGHFTDEQIAALDESAVSHLTGSQLGSLTDEQLHAFTPEQVAAIDPGAAAALTPEQLAALDDVNLAPVFAASQAAVSVAENTPAGAAVFTARATDANLSPVHNTLHYSLSGADASLFSIDANTGQISFNATPDYEAHPGAYSLLVTATDPDGASVTQALTVTVTDVNEAPVAGTALAAQVVQTGYAFSYTLPSGAFTDPDTAGTSNHALTLSATLADGSPLPSWLHFDGATFTGTPPSSGPISIKVTATDGGADHLSSSQVFQLNAVNDVPVFAAPQADASVAENTPAGMAVFTAHATEATLSPLLYSLSGADASLFSIDASTGQVSFNATPDYEAHPGAYSLLVTATDTEGASATQALTVTVTDVNEAPVPGTALAAQIVQTGHAFSYTLPGSAFTDPDTAGTPNHALTLSATLADGSALPSWLHFDGATFTGTPPSDASVSVKVTATDGGADHLSSSQVFQLNSISHVQLSSRISGVTNFDVTSAIVLEGSEALHKGSSGTITITDLGGTGPGGLGFGGETITHTQVLSIDDPAVSIVDGKVVITPPYDLDLASHYVITVSAGAFVGDVSGMASSEVGGTHTINFATVTPQGGVSASPIPLSQSMDTQGLHDSYRWWDITHLGSSASENPLLIDTSSLGQVALVFQDIDGSPTAANNSGVNQSSGFYVRVGGLGMGDMIYIDDVTNSPATANNLSELMFNTDGHGLNSLTFDGSSSTTPPSAQAQLEYTFAGNANVYDLHDLQTLLGANAIVSG